MSLLKTIKKFFSGNRNIVLPPDASDRLRQIIEEGMIDEKTLKDRALAYSLLYFENRPRLSLWEAHARMGSYAVDMRLFLIRKVVSHLYGSEKPSSVIECGSAGDISAALALPDSAVTAVDIDADIFVNEISHLPQAWFDSIGIERIIACYGDASNRKFYSRNKNIIDICLPNYHRVIGDGEKLEYRDESYDFALVQGTPDMLEFFRSELSRVLKPGGYLASIIMDSARPAQAPSFYETGIYVSWPEYKRTNPEEEDLPLQTLEIPDYFKKLETLCSWDSPDGMLSTGAVFEMFRKM